MFRLMRLFLLVYLAIVAVDYVRDNVPNFSNFLKLPLPALPTDIADRLGDRVEGIRNEAQKLATHAAELANHPPPGLMPGTAPPGVPTPQDLQKAAQEARKQADIISRATHLPSPANPLPDPKKLF